MRDYRITYTANGIVLYTDTVSLTPADAQVLELEGGLTVEEI